MAREVQVTIAQAFGVPIDAFGTTVAPDASGAPSELLG